MKNTIKINNSIFPPEYTNFGNKKQNCLIQKDLQILCNANVPPMDIK